MEKTKGYFDKILAIDCETSGYASNSVDASYEFHNKQHYQAVSVGLIVVNAATLTPIRDLYVEIKWDGLSEWSLGAERVHGLSLQHLEDNGVTSVEAVEQIGNLILDFWGPDSYINLLGHNPEFDKHFLKRLMLSEGINLHFSNRNIDTNTLGFTVFNTYNSDDLFDVIGIQQRQHHNALQDAHNALKVVQVVRKLSSSFLGD